MHRKFKRIPLYPILFAMFPVLALLGNNIHEVNPGVALRSLLISIAGALVILLIARLALGNWAKAALAATWLLLLFFTYGHLYSWLKELGGIGIQLARHRYLLPAYVLSAGAGILLIWKTRIALNAVPVLNLITLLMLVYPSYQTISTLLSTELVGSREADALAAPENLVLEAPAELPDVYYIILDSHTRSDALLQDFGLDNSTFIQELESLGFYVAGCSRSNYVSTNGSLTSSLNLEYVDDLKAQMTAQGLNAGDVWLRIRHNQVRAQLEGIGYQTFAFDSGFEWSRFSDADVYLSHTRAPYAMQLLQPFEAMLIQSTALLLWSDSTYATMPDYVETPFHGINFALEDHVNRQLFTLDQMPQLASAPGPKFVFAHLIVPHIPFLFEADGSVVTDPGYYSGNLLEPIDHDYLERGYTNQVQFIDERIVEVARQILENSNPPPIIIIQGDHGMENDNRLTILNAYYLPGEGSQSLYSSITPVNSFRVIFNTYFGGNYQLLSDVSYGYSGEIVPETYPLCINP
jgi:hypothetical protein